MPSLWSSCLYNGWQGFPPPPRLSSNEISWDLEMLSEGPHVPRAPRPQMDNPDGKPWKSPLPPTPWAMDTDHALQSSFTTEPVGYRVPWNSQGHSAGATQSPSSRISPRVTPKAHLTHLHSCPYTICGCPGPGTKIASSKFSPLSLLSSSLLHKSLAQARLEPLGANNLTSPPQAACILTSFSSPPLKRLSLHVEPVRYHFLQEAFPDNLSPH